jgi:hypothetical protein
MNDAGPHSRQAAAFSNASDHAENASRPPINFEQAREFLAALAPAKSISRSKLLTTAMPSSPN